MPYFGDAFKEGNEYGSEVLMVIDHTKDLKFGQNSAPGSFASGPAENKSNFFWRPNYPTVNANYPAGGGASVCVRDIRNGRPFQRIRPNTKYIIDVAFANPVLMVLSKLYFCQTVLRWLPLALRVPLHPEDN